MCLSLALSSFSTNVMHLILSQGLGFGIGGCFAYTPTILFMSEWFDKRKGLAFGIVWVSYKEYAAPRSGQVELILIYISLGRIRRVWDSLPTCYPVAFEPVWD